MGNFEKLSVLVIGVIIVMILVVAIHTWTTDPGTPATDEGLTLAPEPSTSNDAMLGGALGDTLDVTLGERPGGDVLGPIEDDEWWRSGEDEDDRKAESESVEKKDEESLAKVETEQGDQGTPAPAADRTVTVKNGDTLGHISLRMYNTTRYWKRIAEANDNLSPQALRAGMVLVIPYIAEAEKGGSGSGATPTGGLSAVRGATYTIRGGDTIQRIAKSAYGSIERWPDIWVENIEVIRNPDQLPVGSQIRLPN